MKYVIDWIEVKLREECKYAVLPDGYDGLSSLAKKSFSISQKIALKRIPQLEQALKILNGDTNKRESKLFKFKNCAESNMCGQYPNCDLCDKRDK